MSISIEDGLSSRIGRPVRSHQSGAVDSRSVARAEGHGRRGEVRSMLAGRPTLMIVALLVAVSVAAAVSPPSATAGNDTIAALGVAPLFPHAAGLTARADIHVTLRRKARLTVTIRRPSGKIVRTLARDVQFAAGDHVLSWEGRNADGTLVRDGPYRA